VIENNDSTDPTAAQFRVDLVGRYEVGLKVIDATGLESINECITIVEALAPWDLYIQLVWNNPQSDIDLHLVQDPSHRWSHDDPNSDCYFAHKEPDWCTLGYAADNPRLDVDDVDGYGPEVIIIDEPCPEQYYIYVHYWSSHMMEPVESPCTIRVYCQNVIAAELHKTLIRDDQLWHVGWINWPQCEVIEDGTVTEGERWGGGW
jgi:hypothetical protein